MVRVLSLVSVLAATAACTAINGYPPVGTGGAGGSVGEGGSTSAVGGAPTGEGGTSAGMGPTCDDAVCAQACDQCTQCSCMEGICIETNVGVGEACSGGYCDGGGACVACLDDVNYPCPGGLSCVMKVCVTPQCENGIQDGSETDVDCGGAECAPCLAGEMCSGPNDCASGLCVGQTCASCASQLDCGLTEYCDGVACKPKKNGGEACVENHECVSDWCQFGICHL